VERLMTAVPDSPAAPPRRGLASAAIRRPVGTLAIASVVFVLGLFFLDRLPVDLLPQITYPQIRVTVNYPGVAPEVMEEQVTRVLERNLAATENLVRITGRASEGRTNVDLYFSYEADVDVALQDASRHLERARTQLPPDIDPPRIYKFDPSQIPIFQAGFTSTARSPIEVRDWLEHRLSPQLLAVEGVGSVEVSGGFVREVEVWVDQERLGAYGLPLSAVSAALVVANGDVAAGNVTGEAFDVMAKTDGRLRSVASIEAVAIPLSNGAGRIPLSEVATVRDGHQEQRLFVSMDGRPATQLTVFKLPDANTVEVVDGVVRALERLEGSRFVPEDMVWQPTRDPTHFIRGSLRGVATAAILGGTLAMVLVLFFLGSLRKAFVVGLSIPIAIVATFALMGAGGLTLNVMSLGGLALGVGLLLDNAIVMLENVFRHRDALGKAPDAAAHDGASEVSAAIVAATLTNLAAVTPFLLVTGLAALVFRELILTISFAILASLFTALTLVPMLAALLARVRFGSGLGGTAPFRAFDAGVKALTTGYRRILGGALSGRWLVLGVAVGLLGGALVVSRGLGSEFLPQVDDGNVRVRLVLPPGAPPEQTVAAARRIEEAVMAMPHVERTFTMAGGHLHGGVISIRAGTANIAVQLAPAASRPEMPAGHWVREAQGRLGDLDLPGRIRVSPPRIQGLRTNFADTDVSIGVVGDDLATLDRIGRAVIDRLGGIPGLDGVELGREERTPLLSVDVDRERAAAFGLTVGEVGAALRDAVDGRVATRYAVDGAEYPIRVRLPRAVTGQAETLGDVVLWARGATPIRLRDVAQTRLGDGPAHIERENQVRILRINADVNTTVADVGTVMGTVRERLADLEMPQGYQIVLGGEEEAIREANRTLTTVVLLALFLVLVVLATQYEGLTGPVVILGTVPLALIGVVAALWLTGTPTSAPVLLGVILLVGIVVNNAILLVEWIERGRRAGKTLREAALEAGALRLRPILMTTATTVLGMLPLAIGFGEGAELMRPLAISVVGGLLAATLLSLFVIPCLYVVVAGAASRIGGWIAGEGAAGFKGRAA
jgi:hydrophobe/amphiphile efflux-1 (HAE1) family protein